MVENVSLKFVEAFEGQGSAIVNSMEPSYSYRVKLPDCVAFDLHRYLEYERGGELGSRKIRHWIEPTSYSRTSGWYYIYAADITKFFDMLITVNFNQKYNFENSQFQAVMSELLSKGYLDEGWYNYYMGMLPHKISVEEMISRLKEQGSYQDYIDYINSYDGNNRQLQRRLRSLIGEGQQRMPEGQCILDYLNPDVLEVFNTSKVYLGEGDYMTFKSPILLDRLLPYVKTMNLNSQYMLARPSEYEVILGNVSDFLIKTSLLEEIEISAYPYDEVRFEREHLNYLIRGLALNTSLRSIIMTNDNLKCEDIIYLITSLGPNSQVTFINVYGSLRDKRQIPEAFEQLLSVARSRNIRLHHD